MLSNCRVILIRPHYAGNLGSVCRVMHNFGMSELYLVNPYARKDDTEAIRMSTQGRAILDNAKEVDDFGLALSDCQMALATSALTEGVIRDRFFGTPDELIPSFVESMSDGRVALVFGPEPSGLSNAEITRCHGMIHIPTNPDYGALNLSHAVGICLYEVHKHWLQLKNKRHRVAEKMPPMQLQELMFQKLQEGLEGIHFLFGQKSEMLMHAVRHLISRAKPREKEVLVLMGLARQLKYVADQWREATGKEFDSPESTETNNE